MITMDEQVSPIKPQGVVSCFISLCFDAGFSHDEVREELFKSGVEDAKEMLDRWLWSDET